VALPAMGRRRKIGCPSDWKWRAKLVGGSVRKIRLDINSEKRMGAARHKPARTWTAAKSSGEPLAGRDPEISE
jgi:hypothetical protein